MKRILIIGASSHQSIGYMLGECLRTRDTEVSYTSRSGNLGVACDILNSEQVDRLITNIKPTHIILGAGVYIEPSGSDEARATEHVLAKSVGAMHVLSTAMCAGGVSQLVLLGGRRVSDDPQFLAYTVANGALWSLVEFAKQHVTRPDVYYLDLPFVRGSTMEQKYQDKHGKRYLGSSIGIEAVEHAVQDVFNHRYEQGTRIMLGAPKSP